MNTTKLFDLLNMGKGNVVAIITSHTNNLNHSIAFTQLDHRWFINDPSVENPIEIHSDCPDDHLNELLLAATGMSLFRLEDIPMYDLEVFKGRIPRNPIQTTTAMVLRNTPQSIKTNQA